MSHLFMSNLSKSNLSKTDRSNPSNPSVLKSLVLQQNLKQGLKQSAIVFASLSVTSTVLLPFSGKNVLALEPAPSASSANPMPPLDSLQVPNADVILETPAPQSSAPTIGNDAGSSLVDRTAYDTGATALETPAEALAGGGVDQVNVVIESREQKPGFSPIAASNSQDSPVATQINLGEGMGGFQISSNQGLSWTPSAPSEQSVVPPLPAYLNQKLLRPFSRIGLQNLKFTYPLAIPSPITSLFGWRIHPISGMAKMHTGTDLAAPEGTPVLAAMAGKVLLADTLGGYGLTIALEHENGTQQTLYGHLSEIFVRPGELIQQGAIIGRVGSTGNSTGPHLHLEFRQLTDAGWMAIDPGSQLENSMKDLTQALKTSPKPQTLSFKPNLPAAESPSLKLQLPNVVIPNAMISNAMTSNVTIPLVSQTAQSTKAPQVLQLKSSSPSSSSPSSSSPK